MRLPSSLLKQPVKRILQRIFRAICAAALLLFISQPASAQCIPNPTGETAVGFKNESSFSLTIYIDAVKKAEVPIGEKSADFIVAPVRHILNAEVVIGGQSFWVTYAGDVPEGFVCTLTIADPEEAKSRKKSKSEMRRSLRRK